MPWRDRREQTTSLELWEILAEEFEVAGELPRQFPSDFDPLAEAAVAAKAVLDAQAACDRDAATLDSWSQAKWKVEQALYRQLHTVPRTALCLSGGGVRSATFSLGVVQGLAAHTARFLPQFDFLSTVSGGGYLGSWFSAWASPERGGSPAKAAAALAARPNSTLEPEPVPLRHIRQYCAFLNPKLGALSADTWMLAATVMRNLILNWTILIPLLLALLLVPELYSSFLPSSGSPLGAGFSQATLVLGGLMSVLGSAYVFAHLPVFCGAGRANDSDFVTFGLLPLSLAATFLSLHWAWHFSLGGNYPWYFFAAFGGIAHGAGAFLGVLATFRLPNRPARPRYAFGVAVLYAFLSGALSGIMVYLFSQMFARQTGSFAHSYIVFAIPLVMGAFTAAAMIMVGLASEFTGVDDREWWSRAGGWLLIVMCTWLIFSASIVYGPELLRSTFSKTVTYLGTLTLGSLASWIGFSPKTSAGRQSDSVHQKNSPVSDRGGVRDWIGVIAGPLFLLCLVAVLTMLDDTLLGLLPSVSVPFLPPGTSRILFLLFLDVAFAWFCARLINVNQFSLHSMYRTRLIRTYLGASRPNRAQTVNRFTDMDDADDLAMAQLSPERPLHIVNMALNLVGGSNLAWQQRKAESFTASRLRTGSLRVGYQQTAKYGGREGGKQRGLSLGAAVAISGAAASPNMGYHSSPLLSFVMTLFNARLGWWLPNPGLAGKGQWDKDGPALSMVPIVNEALGRTTDQRAWIYLSDGGHFENLGLYEMVLRRCRYIVVVDGSQDPRYAFEDLGNACRKIRVDLGIQIQFPKEIPIHSRMDPRNEPCVTADILYTAVDHFDGATDGKLLYIKASLNGAEPIDVRHYYNLQPDFPQQSTEQLWFNEAQFESYRRLGQFMAESIGAGATGIEQLFEREKLHARSAAH